MRTSLHHDLDCICPQIIWEQEAMGKIALANIKKGFVSGAYCLKILWRPRGKNVYVLMYAYVGNNTELK